MSTALTKAMVLLDTNALTVPFRFRIDIQMAILELLGAIPVKVPSAVLTELENLKGREPTAKAALKYAERFEVLPTPPTGDDAVLACALENDAFVFTNDRAFIKRLKEKNVPVLLVRKRQKVVIEYP